MSKRRLEILMLLWILGVYGGPAQAGLPEAERYIEAGELQAALAEVQNVLEHNPSDPETRFLHGIVLAEMQRDDEAIEVFASLTQDHPELPEPYNNLAVLFAQKGEFEKARDALQAAIRTHPSYSTAHENLGDLYAKMASQAYDRALEENRRNESARLKLAKVKGLFSVPTDTVESVEPASVVLANEPPSQPAAVVEESQPAPVIQGSTASDPDILELVAQWSSAWAAQNVDAYLAHYASGFRPRGDMSHEDWLEQRRSRLSSPEFIELKLDNIRVSRNDGSIARAEFVQDYRTDNYSDRVKKILDLTKEDGVWRISRERSLPL